MCITWATSNLGCLAGTYEILSELWVFSIDRGWGLGEIWIFGFCNSVLIKPVHECLSISDSLFNAFWNVLVPQSWHLSTIGMVWFWAKWFFNVPWFKFNILQEIQWKFTLEAPTIWKTKVSGDFSWTNFWGGIGVDWTEK